MGGAAAVRGAKARKVKLTLWHASGNLEPEAFQFPSSIYPITTLQCIPDLHNIGKTGEVIDMPVKTLLTF
jgi:hypothetical protein